MPKRPVVFAGGLVARIVYCGCSGGHFPRAGLCNGARLMAQDAGAAVEAVIQGLFFCGYPQCRMRCRYRVKIARSDHRLRGT